MKKFRFGARTGGTEGHNSKVWLFIIMHSYLHSLTTALATTSNLCDIWKKKLTPNGLLLFTFAYGTPKNKEKSLLSDLNPLINPTLVSTKGSILDIASMLFISVNVKITIGNVTAIGKNSDTLQKEIIFNRKTLVHQKLHTN